MRNQENQSNPTTQATREAIRQAQREWRVWFEENRRNNNLFDPQNKRRILADLKLKELLKLKPNDELTYYNLQKYLSPLFVKN